MSNSTLSVPATMGVKIEISGDIIGSFLVHRSAQPTFINDDLKFLWNVTHVASGMRHPFDFFRKAAAVGFAKDIEGLLDWSAVSAKKSDDPTKHKAEWVSGKPTKEQTAAIYAAAEAHGAYKP